MENRGHTLILHKCTFHLSLGLLSAVFSQATLQSKPITTFAGGPAPGPTPALSVGQHPDSVAVHGNLVYISDNANLVVRVLDTTTGQERVVAGNGTPGFSGDGGPATSAQLGFSNAGVAVDRAGNIYVADPAAANSPGGSDRVRKISTSGVMTTVAGNGTFGFSGDGGRATSAQLNTPTDVAVDAAGNRYISDTRNHRIRKVDTSGIITTVAGTGVPGFSGDGGPATAAEISFPNGICFRSGNLYIADSINHRIRKVDSSGTITTIAGSGPSGRSGGGFAGDGGQATRALLYQPIDVTVDRSGNVFIVDFGSARVRKVDTQGIIDTVAGNGTYGFSGDGGPATSAQIELSRGLAVDAAGQLYIADSNNYRVRRVDAAGIINTVAGNGSGAFSGDGGRKKLAQLALPEGIAVGPDNSLYISDVINHRIRRIGPRGIITTVAGNAPPGAREGGFGGDGGPATSALLNFPRDVAVDPDGNLYIADTENNRIRKVNAAGIITTVAGTGTPGFSGDGRRATAAQINYPRGVEIDSGGRLYICDSGNAVVRKVNSFGVITTVAGIGGLRANAGDGGPATKARLNFPWDLAFDAIGNFYISDFTNGNVRKVDTSGIISTVAGTGVPGFSGDFGPATKAQLLDPAGLVVDSAGNLYIADAFSNRVRKVDSSGIIRTIAGTGPVGNNAGGFAGDGGPATSALLNAPVGLAIGRFGSLYISEAVNNRIRRIHDEAK